MRLSASCFRLRESICVARVRHRRAVLADQDPGQLAISHASSAYTISATIEMQFQHAALGRRVAEQPEERRDQRAVMP